MISNRFFPFLRHLLVGVFAICVLGNCAKREVVKWPELRAVDELGEKIEGWNSGNNVKAMREALPEVLAAGKKLIASGVPANAVQPKAVEQSLGDLRDLLQQLEKPNLSDDDLKAPLVAIHPLVVKLLEQSGVPHVHGHDDHDHDHDHDDHGHEKK